MFNKQNLLFSLMISSIAACCAIRHQEQTITAVSKTNNLLQDYVTLRHCPNTAVAATADALQKQKGRV